MKKHLQYQKTLMEKALKILADHEQIKAILGGVDDKYVEEKQAEYRNEYAWIMRQLVDHLAIVTKFKLVPLDMQNNVVSMAEQTMS